MDQETLRGQASEYRIYESIASGGFGTVFIGRDIATNVPVAVKRLHPHLKNEPGFVERFELEAATVRGLVHPNIVRLIDQGRDGQDVPFLVMEWVEGLTIADWLKRRGRYTSTETAVVGCQVLEGLNAAWTRHVIHRDIKPANLMVTTAGQVKIMDFGVAKELDMATLTGASGLLGTPAYMAPEQLRGQPLDCRADLYSLGVTLYMMLAGHPPFEGPSFADYFRQHLEQEPPPIDALDVDSGFVEVLGRALAKQPEDRFGSPAEMLAALRPYAEKTVLGVTPPGVERTQVRTTQLAQSSFSGGIAVATVSGPLAEPSRAQPAGTMAAVRPATSSVTPVPTRAIAPWMIAIPAVAVVALIAAVVLFAIARPTTVIDERVTPVATAAATLGASGAVFSDALDDVSKARLPRASTSPSNYFVGYGADGYTIQKLNQSFGPAVMIPIPGDFGDATAAVDARVIDPTDNRFVALGCRDTSLRSGYQLRVFPSSGHALLARIDSGVATTLTGPQSPPTLTKGDGFNHLELLCTGASITARINGAPIGSAQDETYPDGGLIIGAGNDPGGPMTVEAHFKNLVVRQP